MRQKYLKDSNFQKLLNLQFLTEFKKIQKNSLIAKVAKFNLHETSLGSQLTLRKSALNVDPNYPSHTYLVSKQQAVFQYSFQRKGFDQFKKVVMEKLAVLYKSY